jgi:hypothetical protein
MSKRAQRDDNVAAGKDVVANNFSGWIMAFDHHPPLPCQVLIWHPFLFLSR